MRYAVHYAMAEGYPPSALRLLIPTDLMNQFGLIKVFCGIAITEVEETFFTGEPFILKVIGEREF